MNERELNSLPAGRSTSRVIAATALSAAAVALLSRPARAVSPALTFNDIPGTGDNKVLNYALALEDLEADLYSQALKRLTTGGTNALGTTIPGLNLAQSEIDVAYVQEYSITEREHRDFLRAALGNAAITQYKYNFNMQNLTRRQVVELIYTAEKTGVGAYLGAIKFFETKNYLRIAGAIQGTEARHTAVFAIVQNILFNTQIATAPLATDNNGIDQPITPDTVLAAVSPFIVIQQV